MVLRVEVRVTFPTSALSRNTPVMQAVLFEDLNDARFLNVWPVSQVKNLFALFCELDKLNFKNVCSNLMEVDWILHRESSDFEPPSMGTSLYAFLGMDFAGLK